MTNTQEIEDRIRKNVYVIDDQHPEDNAMMQALYSRSPKSVTEHLEKVKTVGSGQFMDQYYVGYNHASIGDCGSTTVYVEYVSMLMAKAIQDTPLYSGQEASTRYIDFSKQPVLNPLGTEEGKNTQALWMDFYKAALEPVADHVRATYPQGKDEGDKAYNKAVKARTFDILRGFLPAGATTFVSWHTNLRQAAEHLMELRHYPVSEVRGTARVLLEQLQKKYKHSFNQKLYDEAEAYRELTSKSKLYDPTKYSSREILMTTTLSDNEPWWALPEIKQRPAFSRLPHRFDSLGQVTYEFLLDFGSFRDLQRHRNGVCEMPLLTTRWGFNEWYLDQLPSTVRGVAEELIEKQSQRIKGMDAPDPEKQHYVAMGFNMPCKVTRGLPGTLYLIELRTTPMVHPTMRAVAAGMAKTLRSRFPQLTIHDDKSVDSWDVRRGTQDIEER